MSIAHTDTRQAILDGLALLWEPGGTYELRVLNAGRSKTVSGYFRDPGKFAHAAAHWNGKAPGIYMTINPVEPSLLARASDRALEFARVTTSDTDIVRRRWLPLDFDPVRPAGISATDAQHDAAIERAVAGAKLLISSGVPRDSIVLADSGNGGHLLVRIDLPNSDEATQLVRHVTEAISLRLSDDQVKCDLISFNAARIWKVYGSLACKGDDLPEFPHRVARLLKMPETVVIAPHQVLVALADQAPPTPPARTSIPAGQRFNVEDFIGRHLSGTVEGDGPWNGGRKWVLVPCPFNAEHTDRSAVIVEHASGALAFKCHHNSCIGKSWSDVRDLFEPREMHDLAPVHAHEAAGANGGSNGNGHQPPVESGPDTAVRLERFPLTDLGNAERFALQHGEDVRFVSQFKKFRVWRGDVWCPDETGMAARRAKATVRSIRDEANVIDNAELRQKTWAWGVKSESGGHMREMMRFVQVEGAIATSAALFDQDPWLLACPNGTVNLHTGELRESRREDFISHCCSVPYIRNAPAPIWDAALERWTGGNRALRRFLHKAVGASLIGGGGDEVFFFLYGSGRNGKSKFLEAVRGVMGDYAKSIRPEALMVKQGDGIPNEIAQLIGARFVSTTEVEEGARFAESLVKQLTGGDTISARFMRAEFFEFRPVMTLWIAGNHRPTIRGVDKAIWERILTIPFTVEIPREERDPTLQDKLTAEGAGILAWAIEGCLLWKAEGLDPPPEVREATEEYRGDMDILGQFIADCCVEQFEAVTPASFLYQAYIDWCQANHEKQWSQQLFGRKLRERGFESTRTSHLRVWEGLGVRTDGDTNDA